VPSLPVSPDLPYRFSHPAASQHSACNHHCQCRCDHADSQLVSFHVLTTSADIFLSISEAFLNLSLSSCFSYSKQYFPSGAIYTQKPVFFLSVIHNFSSVLFHFVENICRFCALRAKHPHHYPHFIFVVSGGYSQW